MSQPAMSYATTHGDLSLQHSNGHFRIKRLNGNPLRGEQASINHKQGRIGAIWIGHQTEPTAACAYTGWGSGLGGVNTRAACSTWVR